MPQPESRDPHYRAIFESMAEGFALCEAIWDQSGRLADYIILEMNPALQAMAKLGPAAVGRKFSEISRGGTRWLATCDRVLRTGKAAHFEYRDASTGRWHDVRLTRVTPNQLAQFVFDITERKETLARQAELMDELNHRVSNNLAMVAALLRLQARSAEPAVREQLSKAIDRVQTIAAVHASLYQGGEREEVDFAGYLTRLCDQLSTSVVDEGRIRIDVDAAHAKIPVDQAVPLGIVVNELVTNAAKYAYPAPAKGAIAVHFGSTPTGLTLSVADEGRGLSAHGENQSSGLGMKLVRSLVQQMGGTLTAANAPGATFEILVPRSGVAGRDDRIAEDQLL